MAVACKFVCLSVCLFVSARVFERLSVCVWVAQGLQGVPQFIRMFVVFACHSLVCLFGCLFVCSRGVTGLGNVNAENAEQESAFP